MLNKTDRDYFTFCISNFIEVVCLISLIFVVFVRTKPNDNLLQVKRDVLSEVRPLVDNVSSNLVKLSSAFVSLHAFVTNDYYSASSVFSSADSPSADSSSSSTGRFERLSFGLAGDNVSFEGMIFSTGDLTPYGVLNFASDNFIICDDRVYFRSFTPSFEVVQ